MKSEEVRKIVSKGYTKIAKGEGSCCTCSSKKNEQEEIAKNIGYSKEELKVPGNLGLGCGNPIALSNMKEGDTVLDLGSGAGFDCFLASRKVGKTGKVIGVDMTVKMIQRARENALKNNYSNVEFKLGEIENLPIQDESIDVIISNCVINLSPEKEKVFKEAKRVLKKSGKMYVSDIVLLKELEEERKNNPELLCGCVAGAVLKEDYLNIAKKAGLKVKILGEDTGISKKQYSGIPLESLKLELTK